MTKKFWKNEYFLVFIAALALSFAIFGNGIGGGFVFDDTAVIEKRGDLKDIGNFFNLFVSPYHQNMAKSGLYRPVTMASYALSYLFTGSSPAGFHVVNIIIHGLNAGLLFWLVMYLFNNRKLAYFSGLLFLFHPIHTEAVTSIVGRAELLMFGFSLLSLYFFSRGKFVLSALIFLLALGSKETALAILPIIYLLGVYKMNYRPIMSLKKLLYFIPPLAIYLVFRFIALGKYFISAGTTTIIENPLKFALFGERIATAFKILYLYLEKLLWPVHLSADYSYNTIKLVPSIFSSWQAIIGAAVFVGAIFIIFYSKTRNTVWSWGTIIFILPYLIISNLILPVGTIMGERLMYFPSAGFIILFGYLLCKLSVLGKHYSRVTMVLLGLVLAFWGVRTLARNTDWLSNEKLFKSALNESGDGLITRTGMAAVNLRAGRWSEAERQLIVAQQIYPDNSHEQNLLGIVAEQKGDLKTAEEKYRRSIELNDDAINAYINLGKLYLKQNKFDLASQNFLKVIEFSPVEEYVLRYMYARIAVNDPDSALAVIAKYYNGRTTGVDLNAAVGTAYFVKKDYSQALKYLTEANRLGADKPEILQMIEIARQKSSQ